MDKQKFTTRTRGGIIPFLVGGAAVISTAAQSLFGGTLNERDLVRHLQGATKIRRTTDRYNSKAYSNGNRRKPFMIAGQRVSMNPDPGTSGMIHWHSGALRRLGLCKVTFLGKRMLACREDWSDWTDERPDPKLYPDAAEYHLKEEQQRQRKCKQTNAPQIGIPAI